MFTGLVEGLGEVVSADRDEFGMTLALCPPRYLLRMRAQKTPTPHRKRFGAPSRRGRPTTALGDSICINGCCLTIVSQSHGQWTFQAGPETLKRTNLGRLRVGEVVNLERSLPPDGRLGGHVVQGHVDGLGRVARIDTGGEWVDMTFEAPPELTRLMVEKGSVAVDGVSLTVVSVTNTTFSVSLIPHTLAVTTLGRRRVGDEVNLEADILGKYVAKLVDQMRPPSPA
jgi:riboflavin synthase